VGLVLVMAPATHMDYLLPMTEKERMAERLPLLDFLLDISKGWVTFLPILCDCS
jgi:hypothetical protein